MTSVVESSTRLESPVELPDPLESMKKPTQQRGGSQCLAVCDPFLVLSEAEQTWMERCNNACATRSLLRRSARA